MVQDVAFSGMVYHCCDPRRRDEFASIVAGGARGINAVDFLEVLDSPAQPHDERQRTLLVHFLQDPTALGITAENVRIEGGERIRDVRVVSADVRVEPATGSSTPVLVVVVDAAGDFSTYTLRLIPAGARTLAGLDPLLRAVDFSFKVACPTTFDPAPGSEGSSPAPQHEEPTLDYLARDFTSLRQLMLDRMSLLIPDWTERNAADLGVTLVELLAYVGDQLSYRQDAVATEAYLATCRRRASARRHARLVDYFMHDGCNARAWVQIRLADGTPPFELREATFHTAVPGLPRRMPPRSQEADRAAEVAASTFRLLEPALLVPEHNEMTFHAWGARECRLPRGAVRATLRGSLPHLSSGMVLVLVEARSPHTGEPADADLSHRHAVRLVDVQHREDPIGGRFDDPPTADSVPVTEIRWADEDALPFPLCISAETEDDGLYIPDVSVALGNLVLADHGAAVREDLGIVPDGTVRQLDVAGVVNAAASDDGCHHRRLVLAPPRFRPGLTHGPVTQAVPYDPNRMPSAAAAMRYHPRDALPQVTVSDSTSEPWRAQLDLLGSSGSKHFVVEVEASDTAGGGSRLRFGDGTHGAAPPVGQAMRASYRVGNGAAGNVGAMALVHIVTPDDGIESVGNPLPATGGVDLESIEEVRQHAPVAFRPQSTPGPGGRPLGQTLRRAVTPADYAAVTEAASVLEADDVQLAAATFRWTGSWRTVSVTVDRRGGGPVSAEFETALRAHLERYRMAGHDLEVEPPRPVALRLAMRARVRPGFAASQVRLALLDVFSERLLGDGRRGVFHPDNLTFGQTIHLSPLYAAAQDVDGVESVDITAFERVDRPGPEALDVGRLTLGRLEIARLSNDPSFPERGSFELTMEASR
ncbi:hypothetical protein ACFT30_08335 [Microbacterium ureisolvens]|uniref:hypothetical protein n=1 Tax=Microbacterium ureisolvens TaxID=2781186 RepID=UPI003633551B